MAFASGTFSKVTALECAFHFDTREQFIREAFRVLKPGGRIALADGIPEVGVNHPTLLTKLVLRHWVTPVANDYDRLEYSRKLRRSGPTLLSMLGGDSSGTPDYAAAQRGRRRVARSPAVLLA